MNSNSIETNSASIPGIEAFLGGHEVDLNELEEDQIVDDLSKKSGKRKRKETSRVWSMFIKLPCDAYEDGKLRSKCKLCGKTYICDSTYGTGNMIKHMSKCPKLSSPHNPHQMLLSHSEGFVSHLVPQYEYSVFRDLLSSALVMHDLPFQFVEYIGIRRVLEYLQPQVRNYSRNTAKADVLKIYSREKCRIKKMLEDVPGKICLTSDLWSSITIDGYMSLTAHYIDRNWILQKKLLNFSLMSPPHNGVSLAEKLLSLLCEWGIEKKIFSITLDNASANDSSVDLLKSQLRLRRALVANGDFFHIRCCAHIINLIVQDGLKTIDRELYKIRESVKYVKGSQGRKQKFLECVRQVSLDSNKCLRQDVPTRWNSTYLMLESVLYYKSVFCHLELSDSNYKYCPSEDKWGVLENISNFLVLFYEITCVFSGSKYPTSNLYFPKVFVAYVTLKEYSVSENVYLKEMGKKMLNKFLKYWSDFCIILVLSVILDPRYKLSFIEWAYKKIYGYVSKEFNHVRDRLFSLFNEYMVNSGACSSMTTTFMQAGNGCSNGKSYAKGKGKLESCLEEFDNFESMDMDASTQKTELELYLDEPRVERTVDLDILLFWKSNQFRYPQLSCMARDILTIPISTVASESAFSIGGRVLDQFRSALKPDVVEAVICSKDWIYAENVDATNSYVKLEDLTENIINLSIHSTPTILSEESVTLTRN